MGHDVAVHLAHLEQGQIHRVIGDWFQASRNAVIEGGQGALFQECLAALEGTLAKERREHAGGFFRVLPDVREVVLVELLQLAAAERLYVFASPIQHPAQNVCDRLQLRRLLDLARRFHAPHKLPVIRLGHAVEGAGCLR